jgi:hypothetical protein
MIIFRYIYIKWARRLSSYRMCLLLAMIWLKNYSFCIKQQSLTHSLTRKIFIQQFFFIFPHNGACLVEKQQMRILLFLVWLDRGSTALKANSLVQSGHHHHLIECAFFSPWYGWRTTNFALNNNHSLIHSLEKSL